MKNKIYYVIFFSLLLLFFFSCRKKRAGKVYGIEFTTISYILNGNPTSYTGKSYWERIFLEKLTETEMIFVVESSVHTPRCTFNIKDKKLTGTMIFFAQNNPNDTIYFFLSGTVMKSKIMGDFKRILPKNINPNNESYGTFEIKF